MNQGEIWIINLDPTLGAEIRKKRPAIIVNDDEIGRLPLKVIVPLTDWKDSYDNAPWMVKIEPDNINNVTKISSVDCFQIRSLSETRFIRMVGKVNERTLEKIKFALRTVLTL